MTARVFVAFAVFLYHKNYFYMDTYIDIKLNTTKNRKEMNKIFEDIDYLYKSYHELTDRYNSYNNVINIYYLNEKLPDNEEVEIDPRLSDIINLGIEYYDKTNGLLNIAAGNLTEVWKEFINTCEKLPSNEELNKNINIKDLANETGTSCSTITRFAKKIGCDSFVDMKIMLGSNRREKIVSEDEDEIFSYAYHYYNEVIERTKMLIDKEAIFNIVTELREARNIYIYGVGSSGLTGAEMMQRLLRMGFNVHCITDSHMMIINSSIVKQDDLVIGISISGETEEVVLSLKNSQKNGAKTVAITSFEDSSIVEYSDIEFIVYNPKFVNKSMFINSQFSAMYLLDLISMALLKDEELSKKMQITIDAISKD